MKGINMNKQVNHKKIIAIIICLLFIASIFLSMTYIIKEANHNCIGGTHCPICSHIQMAERVIGELGTVLVILANVGLTFTILCRILFHFIVGTVLPTLITQNVRMNN